MSPRGHIHSPLVPEMRTHSPLVPEVTHPLPIGQQPHCCALRWENKADISPLPVAQRLSESPALEATRSSIRPKIYSGRGCSHTAQGIPQGNTEKTWAALKGILLLN